MKAAKKVRTIDVLSPPSPTAAPYVYGASAPAQDQLEPILTNEFDLHEAPAVIAAPRPLSPLKDGETEEMFEAKLAELQSRLSERNQMFGERDDSYEGNVVYKRWEAQQLQVIRRREATEAAELQAIRDAEQRSLDMKVISYFAVEVVDEVLGLHVPSELQRRVRERQIEEELALERAEKREAEEREARRLANRPQPYQIPESRDPRIAQMRREAEERRRKFEEEQARKEEEEIRLLEEKLSKTLAT